MLRVTFDLCEVTLLESLVEFLVGDGHRVIGTVNVLYFNDTFSKESSELALKISSLQH